jgi:hypothetical protein
VERGVVFFLLPSSSTATPSGKPFGTNATSDECLDFLHANAARKAGCSHLVTLNLSDFQGLDPDLVIESP